MKYVTTMLVTTILLLAGCEYDAPLTKEHTIPIDSAVLGEWESVPDSDEKPTTKYTMVILRYSDTEYMIHYPTGKDGLYYRGYPINVGGISCIQLEVLGAEDGSLDKDEEDLFHVASYEIKKGILEVKTLNTDVVDDELKDSEALRKAFLKNTKNKDLFEDPGKFKRKKS